MPSKQSEQGDTVRKGRSVLKVERHRAPQLPLLVAGANPGLDLLRQGAVFADVALCGVDTHTVDGSGVSDGVTLLRTLRLRFPARMMDPSGTHMPLVPGARRLAKKSTAIPRRPSVGIRAGNPSCVVLRRLAFVTTNTPQLVLYLDGDHLACGSVQPFCPMRGPHAW